MRKNKSFLPKELRTLVRLMSFTLGKTIIDFEGEAFFNTIESYRLKSKNLRKGNDLASLQKLINSLAKKNNSELLKIAHAFGLLLELVNACEAAFRTWRQQFKEQDIKNLNKSQIDYVLTAHPTESRPNRLILTINKITNLLIEGLNQGLIFNEDKLKTYVDRVWQYPLARHNKITCLDEAEYINSILFSQDIFEFIYSSNKNYIINISTWVGGDKDGHPGVDKEKMLGCLTLSRQYILKILQENLNNLTLDLQLLDKKYITIEKKLLKLNKLLKELEIINDRDGARVTKWIISYKDLVLASPLFIKEHYLIKNINNILNAFEGLVVPIELREDKDLIKEALDKPNKIHGMLKTIAKISKGSTIGSYAHGLIVSHCSSANDIQNSIDLIFKTTNSYNIPVIPLFEDKKAINDSGKIIRTWLEQNKNIQLVKNHWDSKLEIMLGYSDSAKQIGVLSSRYNIKNAMFTLDQIIKSFKLKPIFFHGAGGSIERGGGSLKDQVGWWPVSAVAYPKLTIQGEMVQRNFATAPILHSQSRYLAKEFVKRNKNKISNKKDKVLDEFVYDVERQYLSLLSNNDRMCTALSVTPFKLLSSLKLGSRPSKRISKDFSIDSFRAIPWIMCWTQTRLLFPVWYGVGQAWKNLSKEDRIHLKNLYKTNSFFTSFIHILGFTLSKVEISIWKTYAQSLIEDKNAVKLDFFEKEYKLAVRFIKDVTESNNLLIDKLWLEESINLRSPYVTILNLIQIISIKSHDEKLLKETIVGIASGMVTTG